MTEHQKQSFADTVAEPTSNTAANTSVAAHPAHLKAEDFDEASKPGDLWPEAADAQCSQSAALFAGTQPAPLSIV